MICLDDEIEFIRETVKKISGEHKRLVFFFSLFSIQYDEIKELVKELRENTDNKTETIFIGGGPHITGEPFSVRDLDLNYGISGEGEKSIAGILEFLSNGKHGSVNLNGIPGLIIHKRNENKLVFNRHHFSSELLDCFPPFSEKYGFFGPIEITRGCYHSCNYCQVPQLYGCKVRHRSIENILFHTEKLVENGVSNIRFITPNAASYGSDDKNSVNLKAIELLLRSIKEKYKRRVKLYFGSFPSEIRPESVSKDLLFLIKKFCDNKRIIIGAQTGQNSLLKKINRGHTIEQVFDSVKIILKNGLEPHVDFIFGLPGETLSDREETLRVMNEMIKEGAKMHAHYFMPLPGTPLQNKMPEPLDSEFTGKLEFLHGNQALYGFWKKQKNSVYCKNFKTKK